MKHGLKVFNWLLVFAALVSAFPVSAETTDETVIHAEDTGLLDESNPDDAVSFELEDYELLLDNSILDGNERLENDSSSQDIISSIKSNDVFTMDGTVITDSGECSITEYYDFSKLNKYEIADWAWENSLITEAERGRVSYHRFLQ